MQRVGIEPTHPEIVGLKSTALDHSAIPALVLINIIRNKSLYCFYYFYYGYSGYSVIGGYWWLLAVIALLTVIDGYSGYWRLLTVIAVIDGY
jgi:hypothetical protein